MSSLLHGTDNQGSVFLKSSPVVCQSRSRTIAREQPAPKLILERLNASAYG